MGVKHKLIFMLEIHAAIIWCNLCLPTPFEDVLKTLAQCLATVKGFVINKNSVLLENMYAFSR